MLQVRRLTPIGVVLFAAAMQTVPAQAFDLTGAWASQGDLCKLVFMKKGNALSFTELSDLYGSGFIIDGDRITGKTAKCTITSRKQNGDNLELGASCATSIMHLECRFSSQNDR